MEGIHKKGEYMQVTCYNDICRYQRHTTIRGSICTKRKFIEINKNGCLSFKHICAEREE